MLLPDSLLLSREEIWRLFAREIGGEYTGGDFWHPETITAHLKPWTVTLDLFKDSERRTQVICTRLRSFYVPREPFIFSLYRENVFQDFSRLAQIQEITIGEEAFDNSFRLCGSDESHLRALLANDALRGYLLKERQIGLATAPAPHDRALIELNCQVVGAVEQPSRLLGLFELMGETLQHLEAIGAARAIPP